MEDKKEFQDFDLDDILSEFGDDLSGESSPDDFSGDLDDLLGPWTAPAPEEQGDSAAGVSMDTGRINDLIASLSEEPAPTSEPESPVPEAPAPEAAEPASPEAEPAPATEPASEPPEAPAASPDTVRMNALIDEIAAENEAQSEAADPDDTIRVDDLISQLSDEEDHTVSEDTTIRMDPLELETAEEEEEILTRKEAPRTVYNPRVRLRELKKKLVAGPEKRYYELSEVGVGRLQVAIILNLALVILSILIATLYSLDFFPDNRLRFVIFSQILSMLLSALLGCHQILDGLGDLFKGRFTINTMLFVTFAACCADAVFCLSELRIPCCAAFSMEITMALWARYQRRSTETAQMDTLRKAVRLLALVKSPDYYDGKSGILRRDGEVEDFMDTYSIPSGPEKLQGFYALISLLLCIGIAVFAGMRHGTSMALQILSASLLVAVPASFFVSLTRPAALLERRLHMVGAVLCGWKGVKQLSGKAAFPLRDEDLFPAGTTKLNGVKFYGDRESDEVISYATSLICAAGGSLVPVFQEMLAGREGTQYAVSNFRSYGTGGIGGEIRGESVLVGSLDFLQDMGVIIPEGTMVNQAVYVSIEDSLCAVFAISYAKMRSCTAGIVSLCANRKLTPVLTGSDFMLTGSLLRARFSVNTRRIAFPDREVREALSVYTADTELPSLAISTRDDLSAYAYAVSGARALRTASHLGIVIHLVGGILGMLIMAALAYLGTTELLTPTHVLLYQLVWMVPGLLITEWARAV